MTRCKHGMLPQTCGMCRGLVNSDNQTREYGAGPTLSSRGLTGFMPRANRELLPLRESTEDIVAGPSGRPPTIEEMKETEVDIREPGPEEEEMLIGSTKSVFERKEKKTMEKPMCPKGCGRPSPGLRGDGQPKICKECKAERMREIQGRPAKPAQNIQENIPEPKDQNPYLRTMDELQALLKDHINKAREIHETMVSLKRVSGVEYEIKALSLVG